MSRGLGYKYNQTDRVIAKRKKIVKRWTAGMEDLVGEDYRLKEPHRLHKINLNCGCKQCHYYKYMGNAKGKFKHRDLKMYGEGIET